MSRQLGQTGLASAIIFACALLSPARAQDALRNEVTLMLTDGWIVSDTALMKGEAHFTRAKQIAPKDARAVYAWALVQMHSRKFKEAAETLEPISTAAPDDFYARQAKVWIKSFNRDFPGALVELQSLGLRMDSNETDATEQSKRDAAMFLGRMYGYLSGPAPDTISDAQIKESEDKVLAAMPPRLRKIYDDAHQEAMQKFHDMQKEVQDAQAEDKAAEEKQKADDKNGSVEERTKIKSDLAALEQEYNTAKSQYDAATAQNNKDLEPFRRKLADLDGQARPLVKNIQDANQRASQKEADAAREKDQGKANGMRNDARNIRNQTGGDQGRLNDLQNQANKVKGDMAGVAQKQNALNAQSQADARRIMTAKNKLLAQEKGLDTRAKDADKPATGETARVKSMTAKMNAMANYVPFAIDNEKQRLIDSFNQ